MDKPTTQSILPDDKERLRTLYQEVVARLEDASVIVRRQLGKQHLGLGVASVTFGESTCCTPSDIRSCEERGRKIYSQSHLCRRFLFCR